MTTQVHVVTYTHKHGVDINLFDSYEKAIDAAAEFAYDEATDGYGYRGPRMVDEDSEQQEIDKLHALHETATTAPSTAAAEALYDAACAYLNEVGDANVEISVQPLL